MPPKTKKCNSTKFKSDFVQLFISLNKSLKKQATAINAKKKTIGQTIKKFIKTKMNTLKNKMKKTCTKNEWHDIVNSTKPEWQAQMNITENILEPIHKKLDDSLDYSNDSWDNM